MHKACLLKAIRYCSVPEDDATVGKPLGLGEQISCFFLREKSSGVPVLTVP